MAKVLITLIIPSLQTIIALAFLDIKNLSSKILNCPGVMAIITVTRASE